MNMTDEILNSWTDADECLADKIEMLEPLSKKATQWLSSGGTLIVKQCGNVVTINGYFEFSSVPDISTPFATLSKVDTPPDRVRAVCNVAANHYTVGVHSMLVIDMDGNMYLNTSHTGKGTMTVSCSYIV